MKTENEIQKIVDDLMNKIDNMVLRIMNEYMECQSNHPVIERKTS